LTPIFNATIPQLEFDIKISLRSVFSVNTAGFDLGKLNLDLPAFDLSVETLSHMLSDCQSPPPGTPSDEIYDALIHLNGALVAELSYELFEGKDNGTIDHWTIADPLDKCYAFLPGLGSIGTVPSSSKSPLLDAAPVTTCTSGSTSTTGTAAVKSAVESLSRGDKAGIIVGKGS
jgi:hypothetical protein